MNPELELAKRVEALFGVELSQVDVHRFLEGAAEVLGSTPLQMIGPGVRFRWYRGGRVVEIRPERRSLAPGYSVAVSSFYRQEVVDRLEYLAFEHWDPHVGGTPYLWSVLLADAPSGWWWPGNPEVRSWTQLATTIGPLLDRLPGDLALIPPPWRELRSWEKRGRLAYLWNVSSPSAVGGVCVEAGPEGVTLVGELTDGPVDILVPRSLLDSGEVSMTDVLAGLTGGAGLSALSLFEVEGFDVCPVTPTSWEGLDPGEAAASETRGGIDLAALEALIASVTTQQDREPAPAPGAALEVVPLRFGLPIPQAVDAVERILAGTPAQEVITGLGARPGERLGVPALVGDGWYALLTPGAVTIGLCRWPESGRYPVADLAACAARLCTELEGRYGAPHGTATDSLGLVMRLFGVGRTGIKVSTEGGELTIEIRALDSHLTRLYA